MGVPLRTVARPIAEARHETAGIWPHELVGPNGSVVVRPGAYKTTPSGLVPERTGSLESGPTDDRWQELLDGLMPDLARLLSMGRVGLSSPPLGFSTCNPWLRSPGRTRQGGSREVQAVLIWSEEEVLWCCTPSQSGEAALLQVLPRHIELCG
jgi:hypothetical protein